MPKEGVGLPWSNVTRSARQQKLERAAQRARGEGAYSPALQLLVELRIAHLQMVHKGMLTSVARQLAHAQVLASATEKLREVPTAPTPYPGGGNLLRGPRPKPPSGSARPEGASPRPASAEYEAPPRAPTAGDDEKGGRP